jgi:hypothetical protein
MRRFLIVLAAIVAVVLAAAAALYFTGNTANALRLAFGPHHGWDLKYKAPPPDYAKAESWAALPSDPGLSAYVPKGAGAMAVNPQVDVFFIHPTGYMHGADWNSPLDPKSQTEENTRWMIANQASVFNGCCAVYAPRYREGSIFRYLDASKAIYKQAGALAYSDVDRAFTYFLEHYSQGRPFILASHSQGTEHAFHLIQARIDGTPLAARMVAAYLLGGDITDRDVAALKTVRACNSATDLHCVMQWDTFGNGAKVSPNSEGKLLCVNPLTWRRDGAMAPRSLAKGAVPASGDFQMSFWSRDVATGVKFEPLGAPVRNAEWAECRDGRLFVSDMTGTPFAKLNVGGKNYHGADYPLFAMDIRENAQARVAAYLARQGQR